MIVSLARRGAMNAAHKETASGHVAHFDTDIIAGIEAVGTLPSGNVTRCGRNLFDYANADIVDNKIKNDSGTEISDSAGSYNRSYVPVNPNTKYVISGFTTSSSRRVYFYTSAKTWISRTASTTSKPIIVTTPSNCYFIQLQLGKASGSGWDTVQIEAGETATEFEAYTSQTVTDAAIDDLKTVRGINNIFSDSGDISLKYWTH